MSAGRPKAFLKQARGKKKKEQILEDADDYLAAAVDNEDAMGKHRGGDPIKSLRFARKALDLYSQGLSLYPKNFDLAYNKARLELEIATHPALVKALDVPVTDVLQQALTSHRYALSLDSENADTLFNAAQVLTTIAEYAAKDDATPDTEALKYLEQALDYQNQCLQVQETKFTESRRFHDAAMNQTLYDSDDDNDIGDDDGGARLDPSTKTAFEDHEDQQEQWVSIVEPVTANTLIDTILSQLGTLTTLCTLLTSSLTSSTIDPSDSAISPSWIESYSTKLLNHTLPSITSSDTDKLTPRVHEIHRTKAIFESSLLDLAFHTGSVEPETYITALNNSFTSTDAEFDPETATAHARALVTFNAALSEVSTSTSQSSTTPTTTHRWTALSQATTLLTSTSQHPTTKSDTHALATTHLLRGDIALLMYALSRPPITHSQAVANAEQLLKNGEVFYRNAGKLFGTLGSEGAEEGGIAGFKSGVVEILKKVGNGSKHADSDDVGAQFEGMLKSVSLGRSDAWRREQLMDMIDEGLVDGRVFGM